MSLIVKTKKINTKDNTTAEISLIKTNTEILNKMKPKFCFILKNKDINRKCVKSINGIFP